MGNGGRSKRHLCRGTMCILRPALERRCDCRLSAPASASVSARLSGDTVVVMEGDAYVGSKGFVCHGPDVDGDRGPDALPEEMGPF